MPAHPDILDHQESLRKPLVNSVMLHLAFAGVALVVSLDWNGSRAPFGDPNALGGSAVSITPVSQIPLPNRRGTVNPVANDTESRVPAPPKPEPRKSAAKQEPDAVELKAAEAKAKQARPRPSSKYKAPGTEDPDRLRSPTGAASVSPLYGATSGSGGVGIGPGSSFGTQFGYYKDLIQTRVANNWRTQEVDPRLQTAPPVIISFEIERNGTVRDLAILQRSGNPTLDYSCERAIRQSAPFPPLPSGYNRNSARVEFQFQLKR
jgi:periplasmic protein TonB